MGKMKVKRTMIVFSYFADKPCDFLNKSILNEIHRYGGKTFHNCVPFIENKWSEYAALEKGVFSISVSYERKVLYAVH